MDKVLKFYKLVNGAEMSFPDEGEQIVTSDFTYTAQRMGGAPTITCTVRHSYALDTDDKVDYMLWSDTVYATFNGEKYYLLRTPTSTYDNTDRRYKYDVEMVSERVILDNVYLFDVAQATDNEKPDAADRYRGVTNSTKIPFYGDINKFAILLNNSLAFSGLYDTNTGEGYYVVVDEGVVSESHSIEFSDQFFSNALQESYNTFEIPYYFVGKAIHIGTAPNDANIGSALAYGNDNALLSISKQNANSKLINRITGVGDTRNLPYYYPNETPKGQVDVYVPEDNKVIQTNDIQIDNKSLAYSTTELNNLVVFKKYMQNELTEEISKITYFHNLNGIKPYEEYDIKLNWYGDGDTVQGIQPYTWSPITSYVTTNQGRYTFKYHVYIKFSTTRDEGGLIRWVWNANPRYPLIEEQQGQPSPWTNKGKVGTINYAVFENLKVYEERATGQVSQEASVQGAYPSLYIDTPFQGTPNAKGGRDVVLHMEFDMWKHAVDLRVGKDYAPLLTDFNRINFASISLLKTSDVKYVWSAGKTEVEDIKDLGYSLSTRITDILSDTSRKDSIVGESFGLKQISYITPSTNLMPSIYRESLGAERFYNAKNNEYELGDGYYHFNNPYVDGKPKEHIENFDDIYPSIKGMVNNDNVPKPMDRFIEFAYDEGDNDETNPNDDNKLYHPLFYAKLPKLNGDFGFNLFDYASESGAMQITMTSGQCGACTFEIAVDEQTQKNKVQVDENGNLVYDADGKVALGSPQDKQNDTVNNEVWIALRKDINTYPSTMPNVGEHNKPKANEDTFVILNINMPQSYIRAAEKRLDDALIYYMSQHNDEKFNFGIKFSRIYLEEHPEVLSKISENSSVTIDYNNQTPTLYISSFTYRMQPSAILPEITVELVDKLTVHRNVIENAVSQIKGEILERIASIDFLRQGVRHFVRKDVDDTVNGYLRFNKGFESSDDASFGKFKEDTNGAGIYQDESGKWHVEADYLKARNKIIAKSVEIEEAHHIGGQQMLTSASARIDYVVERENAYRCYFLKRDTSGDTIYNKWMVGDQAYCKYFNVENVPTDNTSDIIQKYYWRLVVATSNETEDDNITLDIDGTPIITSEYHFVDLSKTDCDGHSDVPQAQDNIVQLGHKGEDEDRQNAIIMAGAGDGSPYIRQYIGINSFTLPEPETQLKPGENILSGNTKFKTYGDTEKTLEDLSKELGLNSEIIEKLEYGTNILRNSGFRGNYDSKELSLDAVLNGDETEMFSPTFESWNTRYASAEKSEESASGVSVVIEADGFLEQSPYCAIDKDASYILSWKGKGGGLSYEVGGIQGYIDMNDTMSVYQERFDAKQNGASIRIYLYAQAELCDLSLVRGTIPTNTWEASPLDNRQEFAKYESLSYLQNLLKADTVIDGGLVSTGVVNTGLINMGHYDENGKMVQVTAGMSGTWNNDDSVAFFGGGDLAKAIYTVQKYKDNPNYEPTTDELAAMAKAVITHGGRAILQDIILRGYVYAEGGVFKGKVYADGGEFKGKVEATDGEFNGTVNAVGGSFDGNIALKGVIAASGTGNNWADSIKIDGANRKLEITGPSEVDDWGAPVTGAVSKTYVSLGLGDVISVNGKTYVSADIVFGDPYTMGASLGTQGFTFSGEGLMSWQDGSYSVVENIVTIDGALSQFKGLVKFTNLPTKSAYNKLPGGCLYRDGETLKIKV